VDLREGREQQIEMSMLIVDRKATNLDWGHSDEAHGEQLETLAVSMASDWDTHGEHGEWADFGGCDGSKYKLPKGGDCRCGISRERCV